MPDECLDMPPGEEQRITELWAWIATHANGGESIVSAELSMPGGFGTRHVPLIASRREPAERLWSLARDAQRAARNQADQHTYLRLARFVLAGDEE